MSDDAAQVTQLLREWVAGDERARDRLVPLVYETLRRLAQHYLSDERHAQTLQPTALVHEAYVRLVQQKLSDWQSRGHFYGVAAHMMRQVLVDHARRRLSDKRGAGAVHVELEEAFSITAGGKPLEILALNDALEELTHADERRCRTIELRYFSGFSEEEIAQTLSVSVATVRRDLRAAEAWLCARLNPGA